MNGESQSCRRALARALLLTALVGVPGLGNADDAVPLHPLHPSPSVQIGREVAVAQHLRDGEEFSTSPLRLIEHGKLLFSAVWTIDEGGGRPGSKGTGAPLSDPSRPLLFPRNFNRISAPDANSCAGCHNAPFGIAGGGGDIVTNVFVLAQRFDFADFDQRDTLPTGGTVDELGTPTTQQTIGNSRSTLGMFGSGFIEMLARQMTADLRAQRDALRPGASVRLRSKNVEFGVLARRTDGSWDVSRVEGIPSSSLGTTGSADPPNLILKPFHQSGHVVSLRQFTNNAFTHHHGIQPAERFGDGVDADNDGFVDELTRADITASVLFQATLPVPGRKLPRDPQLRAASERGEWLFDRIGCTGCHVPRLPLDRNGWIFTEPNPYNPVGNLQAQDTRPVEVDLTDPRLPGPRLRQTGGVVWVPAYTDLKLHDITSGPQDPNREPLDLSKTPGSSAFAAGNSRFLTRKLWGVANEPPYFHHGQYTTLRQAVVAHAGEARDSASAYRRLGKRDQDSVIEFLKSLQVLEPSHP